MSSSFNRDIICHSSFYQKFQVELRSRFEPRGFFPPRSSSPLRPLLFFINLIIEVFKWRFGPHYRTYKDCSEKGCSEVVL